MPSVIRGNRRIVVPQKDWDPCWNGEDCSRYLTLAARFVEKLPLPVVECLVWKRKFPGLQYDSGVEKLIQGNSGGVPTQAHAP